MKTSPVRAVRSLWVRAGPAQPSRTSPRPVELDYGPAHASCRLPGQRATRRCSARARQAARRAPSLQAVAPAPAATNQSSGSVWARAIRLWSQEADTGRLRRADEVQKNLPEFFVPAAWRARCGSRAWWNERLTSLFRFRTAGNRSPGWGQLGGDDERRAGAANSGGRDVAAGLRSSGEQARAVECRLVRVVERE